MATPNLGIIHIAAAQNQKEVTANTAFDDLDLALTNWILETLTSPNFVLPQLDALTNMVFHFQGTIGAVGIVTLPSSRKLYIVSNQTNQYLVFQGGPGRTSLVAPSASAGGSIPTIQYTILYCDGSNVDVVSGPAASISIGAFAPGTMTNGQVVLYLKLDRPVVFPAGAANSFAVANTAATGSTTITLKKNGVSFATIVFSASGTSGVFTQALDALFNTGDILEIDGPGSADATLANIGITLQGSRY